MDQLTAVGDCLPPVTLYDADGAPVVLTDLLDRPTIIPLVRYYGCMPCKAYLRQLENVRGDLNRAGIAVVGVGGAADYQARHMMENGIGYPLLIDPQHELYAALSVYRIRWWKFLSVFTWIKYFRAARGARQGWPTDHVLRAPGLVILDRDATVQFLYRGETLGDYPPLAEVLAAARQVAAGAPR